MSTIVNTPKSASLCANLSQALANNVRYLRFKHRMSISDLARKTGLSRPSLYVIEEGTANLRMNSLAALAQAFEVDVRELLG